MKRFGYCLALLLAFFVLLLPAPGQAYVVYSEDFEDTDGGYTHSGVDDCWEWGTPVTWPSAAGEGDKCWGTNLNGEYENDAYMTLRSPTIDLTDIPSETPITLNWKQAWDTELYDKETLKVVPTVGSLDTLWENTSYSSNWTGLSADLSNFAGTEVALEWCLDADYCTVYPGIYIDDIVIETPWTPESYTVTASAGPHGTVSPDVASVDAGEDLTVTVTPDEGYELHHLEIEISGDISFVYTLSGDSYTFENVSDDIGLMAYFRFDEQMLADAGLNDLDIISDSFALSIPGSPELPEDVASDDYEVFNFNGVASPDFETLSSGDLPEVPEVRELFLQGLSFDLAMEASSDAEMPIMVTRMELVVSRDVLGEELCTSIDADSEPEVLEPVATRPNIAEDFFRYVRLYKIVNGVPYDLYAMGQEEHPDEGFFSVYSDEDAYYVRFSLALVDHESGKAPAVQPLIDGEAERTLPVQAQLVAYDGFFLVFDGEADGHFRDPLVLGTIPEEPVSGGSGGSCNVSFSPASALFLLPLLGLLKKR